MRIFPAVDIKGGKAVRLRQGRKDEVTVFGDPVEMAKRWQACGAQWLHIIDLDGAFAGKRVNAPLISRIVAETGLNCQVGGGIRSLEDARACLDAGARRIIIGTTALEEPDNFAAICAAFPGRVGVSLDASNGILKTRGWEKDASLSIDEALPGLEQAGAAFVIYTDIDRDGMHKGINLKALSHLLALTKLPVMAAGGVSSMADIKNVASLAANHANLEGVISGRAIYDGGLDLVEALNFARAL